MATRRIVAQTATGVHGQPIETFELYAILRHDFEVLHSHLNRPRWISLALISVLPVMRLRRQKRGLLERERVRAIIESVGHLRGVDAEAHDVA
jgi:hypothetical protein